MIKLKSIQGICTFAVIFNISNCWAIDPDLKKTAASTSQIVGNTPEKKEAPENRYWFTKDTIEFRTKYFSEELKYTNGTENSNRTLKTSSAQEYRLNWYITSGVRWQPMVTLTTKTVKWGIGADDGIDYKSDNLLGMGAGIRYRAGRRFMFTLLGEIEQYDFLEFTDISGRKNRQMIEASPTKVTFLSDILLFQKRRLLVKTLIGPVWNFNKNTANVATNHGYGVTADLFAAFWFTPNDGILFGGQYRMHKQEIKNGFFQADTTRTTTGLFAQYSKTF